MVKRAIVRHAEALRTIIADWREAWQRPDLPFLVVQLPGFGSWMGIGAHDYPTIRAGQQQVTDEDTHAWLCSIGDIGDEHDIHPKQKRPVGKRIALLAMRHLLGADVPADAPRCIDIERKGAIVILRFEHADGGLVLSGAKVNALELLQDGEPVPFRAGAKGACLSLTPERPLAGPVEVRFAQTSWYRINLCNAAEIPALPFTASC